MALSDKNHIRVYANEAKQTSENNDGGLYISDNNWKNEDERKLGAKSGNLAKSASFNTAIRQATYVSTIIGEAIAQRFDADFGTDLDPDGIQSSNPDERAGKWGTKFNKENFIQTGEITTNKLADATNTSSPRGVTTQKIENSSITKEKISDKSVDATKLDDNIIKENMTVGLASKVKYITDLSLITENQPDGTLTIYVGSEEPTVTYNNVLYLITL